MGFMIDVFQALSDPRRRDILELLAAHGELSATAISENFDISAPAISQHLKVLREANLVRMEKRAQRRIYRINPEGMHELQGWAKQLTRLWHERFDALDKLLAEEQRKAKGKERDD